MGAEDLHEINHLRAEMMQLVEQGNALLGCRRQKALLRMTASFQRLQRASLLDHDKFPWRTITVCRIGEEFCGMFEWESLMISVIIDKKNK